MEANGQWAEVAEASAAATLAPTVRKSVRVKLAETEIADLGRELAQEEADLQAIEAERKAANADFRERIEETRDKIKALGEAIKQGVRQEERDVIVRRTNASTIELIDPTTGQVLDTIADVEDDRQLTLADAVRGGDEEEGDEKEDLAEVMSGVDSFGQIDEQV